jgi:soluble lytic murein transglycosylase-like protein
MPYDQNAFDDLISESAAAYSVPPDWIKAVIGTESGFNPNAHNASDPGGGAFGLMQVLYSTAVGLGYEGDPEGLYDPETNIDLGVKLMAQIIQRTGSDFSAMYSAYNSGSATKYLSSTQVAANVNRALTWLSQVAGSIATSITQNPESSSGLLIVVAVGLYLLFK